MKTKYIRGNYKNIIFKKSKRNIKPRVQGWVLICQPNGRKGHRQSQLNMRLTSYLKNWLSPHYSELNRASWKPCMLLRQLKNVFPNHSTLSNSSGFCLFLDITGTTICSETIFLLPSPSQDTHLNSHILFAKYDGWYDFSGGYCHYSN